MNEYQFEAGLNDANKKIRELRGAPDKQMVSMEDVRVYLAAFSEQAEKLTALIEHVQSEQVKQARFLDAVTINYRDLETKLWKASEFFENQQDTTNFVLKATINALVDKVAQKND